MVPRTEGQQLKAAACNGDGDGLKGGWQLGTTAIEGQQQGFDAAVEGAGGADATVPETEREQLGAAACRVNGDGLVGGQHLLARSAGVGRTAGDSG